MFNIVIMMYHRVVNKKIDFKKAPFNLTKIEFIEQIDFLNKKFCIINSEDLYQIIQEGKYKSKKSPLLLTFDDGTKDHAKIVSPILKKKKIPGIFFVPARPAEKKKVLHAHAIHEILINTRNLNEIIKQIDDYFLKNNLTRENNLFKTKWLVPDKFNDKFTNYIKRMLQIGLPEQEREKIVNLFFQKYVTKNETEFVENFYANQDDLKDMVEQEMILFPHGTNHYHMDILSQKELKLDIEGSLSFIRKFNKKLTNWIACYPFGSFNKNVTNTCKKNGAFCGVTTKSGIVKLNKSTELMELPRINNDELYSKLS